MTDSVGTGGNSINRAKCSRLFPADHNIGHSNGSMSSQVSRTLPAAQAARVVNGKESFLASACWNECVTQYKAYPLALDSQL